ncbi:MULTISPECIES: Wzz/FepE/Etk N-terminal domain-containing protein [unclassified Micromonospora]|uniref:Wzz/FepE/Etk N-terminal domain-containing protein n=1 Tax=unclassified Micromonospora TaxID=2617518 RepID=UPI003A8659C1
MSRSHSVEIVDYLRIARRRLLLLVGVPVLAAGAAATLVLIAPQQYTAMAYVAAPALVGGTAAQQFTGNQAANQFAAAFSAAATSPRVIDEVVADTGVAANRLRSGLVVNQVGVSSQMEITFTSPDRATVSPVLTATVERALAFLFSSQVAIATEQVAAASADVAAATAAITAWEKENKVTQPDKIYQATLNEMASLRQQRLQMQAVGNGRGADAATEAIKAGQKQLDTIGPKLADYQALIAQCDAATGALSSARQGLQSARAQVQAADPAEVASIGAVRAVSRTTSLINTTVSVAGAGLLLAVILVAMLELLARNRAGEPPASSTDSPNPPPGPRPTGGDETREIPVARAGRVGRAAPVGQLSQAGGRVYGSDGPLEPHPGR